MRRPICSLVGLGGGVNVPNGVGKALSLKSRFEILILLAGSKTHKTIAAITRINPIGRRKLRARAFRREKIRRLDIGLLVILHRIDEYYIPRKLYIQSFHKDQNSVKHEMLRRIATPALVRLKPHGARESADNVPDLATPHVRPVRVSGTANLRTAG